MSASAVACSCRRLGAVVAAIGVALAAAPALAQASTIQATCADFNTKLASAGSADTIVLTGMCSGASYTLPNVTGLTITGAATGTNGFDGTGASGPALTGGPNANGLTLSRLTFQNYATTAVRLAPNNPSTPYTIANDTFSHNSQPFDAVNGSGGGLSLLLTGTCTFSATAVTITDSTFDSNSDGGSSIPTGGGGGGAHLQSACASSASVAMTLTGNRFTNNTAAASGSNDVNGGGLFVGTGLGVSTPPLTLDQSGNLFRGNSVTGTGGSYSGGGEYTIGAELTSTADGFIANSLPGPSVSGNSSEGAGLATLGGGLCINPEGVTSSAANLVAAGNTIAAPSGSGTGAGVEGAGAYIGCGFLGGAYHMTLINSTISGNAATGAPTGAIAGIDGESIDFLNLRNTIVSGDTGGAELGGFGASTGANVTADASDVCAVGSTTTAFAGAANQCTSPLLVDPVHGDVHQTASSPMIDAGANVDLPNNLTSDYYGDQRLQYGHISDTAPRVDIGASEFHPSSVTASNCGQLASLLGQAVNGDVITLVTMCTGGSFTIPDHTSLTLQGAPTGTNGLDGVGATGEALHGDHAVGVTLRNLTIRNYTEDGFHGASAVDLQLDPGPLPTIDHVQFLRNTSKGEPAGLLVNGFNTCGFTGSLTVSDSTFADNLVAGVGLGQNEGAGAALGFGCPAHVVVSRNTFTGNTVQTSQLGYGAGLFVFNGSTSGPLIVQQDHNVFRGNGVVATGVASSQYFGGGEADFGATLTSTDDTYIGNALPGPAGSSAFSQGGGLAITDSTCGGPGTPVAGTAINLIAAGNTIGASSAGGTAGGAGVFAGCGLGSPGTGGPLTLINATVSGNSLAAGVAGLQGGSPDRLTLSNSIIAGNTGAGAANIGGFGIGGGGGSAAATYSDVCAPGTSSPLPGAHNLCADPKLAGASTGDAHETSASPTIDAGSNALVPAGLTTDAYGATRIFASRTCAAVVDMGAAEFGTRTATCPPPPPPPAAPKTVVRSEKSTSTGVDVSLGCTGTGTCSGRITLTTTETRTGNRVLAVASAKRPVRRKVTVTVGSANYRVTAGKRATLHVKLNGTGKSLLARFHKLPLTVRVTQTIRKTTVRISSRKHTIVGPKPKPKRKH